MTSAADGVDYNRDVRPILSDNCFACHGPDEASAQGGLRLDLATEATRPTRSRRHAVVPGKPEESELIDRISADDPTA